MKRHTSPFNLLAAVLATVIVAFGATMSAAATDADFTRESQDRVLINELMWKYVRALDSMNESAYVEVFTPDGEFSTGKTSTKGREALRKMVADLKKTRAEREAKGEKQAAMHHVIANSYIEFVDKDHARFHSYWMTAFAGSPGGATPRIAAVGRGVDDLVRVNGKWLIQTRNVAPQD
jgi:hypothetical protein